MSDKFYSRSQVERGGLSPERISALLLFLWGPAGRTERNKEFYDLDKHAMENLMWTPVDVKFELTGVYNL